MKALITLLLLACSVSHFVRAETLTPLPGGQAPQDFTGMWAGFDPRAEPLDTEVLKQWEEDGVVMQILRYRVGIFKGQKSMMAAVYGYPKGAGESGDKVPGLVQIHGGGQYADYKAVLTNARRGYATISIAWAGRIAAPDYHVAPNVVKLFWDGKKDDPHYKITTDWGALDAYHAPSKMDKDAFVTIPAYEWSLDPVKSPRNNSWFLCTMAARRALTFLEQQPQVDANKLGVYGHSMGGKLTVLTAASDKRVKAAAPSCGGISDRANKDPLHRNTVGDSPNLKQINCPVIFLSPANDFHGRIADLITATDELGENDWRVTCSAHINHKDLPQNEVATQLWFDQHLKGSFKWPATPAGKLILATNSDTPRFQVRPDSSMPIAAVDIYYSQHVTREDQRDDRENSINRFWHHARACFKDGVWCADLPLSTTGEPLWVYANVLYKLPFPVTGAGYYYSIYNTEHFNLSSLLDIATPEQLAAAGLKATLKPDKVIETFADNWQKEWFTTNLEQWGRQTHKIFHPLWKAPAAAQLCLEVSCEQTNKIVMGIDGYAAEVTLAGGPDVQTITLTPADFRDVEGNVLPSWQGTKELSLAPTTTLRSKKEGVQTLTLGSEQWQGSPPQFRSLRWADPAS